MTEDRPPHPSSQLFNSFLADYQEDMRKIIGKHRYANHLLDPEEIASRANLMLVKKRDDILYEFEGDFDSTGFAKIAYRYIRNVIGWSHTREAGTKYVKNRVDSTHTTDEGPKTTFDLALATQGYDEEGFESFDKDDAFKSFFGMVADYSQILSDNEQKILSCLIKGHSHEYISEQFNVTRQAVSHAALGLFDKIQAHFPTSPLNNDGSESVSQGNQAIKDFFNQDYALINDKDRKLLKKFIMSNPKRYTADEVSQKFHNRRYTMWQIVAFCSSHRLHCFLKKANKSPQYTPEEKEKLVTLFCQGKTSSDIAKLLGKPLRSVAGKKGFFRRLGLIPTAPTWNPPENEKSPRDS